MAKPRKSKSGTATIDKADLKRKLIALSERAPPLLDQVGMERLAEMRARGRAAGKRMAPLFAKALDLRKADALLKQGHDEKLRIARQRTPELIRAQATMSERFRHGAANRLKALEVLSTPGLPFTPTYIAVKPFLIWAQPSNMLIDTSIAPTESWAKIYYYTDKSTSYAANTLTFYYLWDNPSAYYAVVNAACSLRFKGSCMAEANTGIFDGGTTTLNGYASLQPIEWWNQPPTYPSYEMQSRKTVFGLYADGGGFWSMETGDVDLRTMFEGADLRYDIFAIPPGRAAVFTVTVQFQYSIDDGEVLIDFQHYDYRITCPYLQIELLTAPNALGNLNQINGVLTA